MLVIKIELWPGGAVTRAREIGRVFVSNQSELADTSNYLVRAESQAAPHLGVPAVSDEFVIEGHDRLQPVFALLAKVFGKFAEPQKTDN